MPFDAKTFTETPAPVVNPLTLEALIAWLETKPADEVYDPMSGGTFADGRFQPGACVLCQWIDCAIGEPTVYSSGGEYSALRDGQIASPVFTSWEIEKAVARAEPHTFGAALNRARELLAARG